MGLYQDISDADALRLFAVNVGGVLNTVLPALAIYRERPEGRVAKRIAVTASMTGYHGMPQCPAYSAGKACVQNIFTLSDGSVLKLTTEKMLYPGRTDDWEGAGIPPGPAPDDSSKGDIHVQ